MQIVRKVIMCLHFCAINLDLYNNCTTAEKLNIKQPGVDFIKASRLNLYHKMPYKDDF